MVHVKAALFVTKICPCRQNLFPWKTFHDFFPDYEKVLVVAGYSSGYINDVEVLDLSKQSSNCDVLPDYPIALELMTGALLEGGSMVKVCGGWDLEDTYTSCYDLNAGSGAWREAEPMMQERYNHASSVVGDKWFITGGYVSNFFF